MDALLQNIETVNREEKYNRWKAIFELAESSPEVARRLRELALRGDARDSRYQRFVAAANVAGFGQPTRIGPNHLDACPLGWYLVLMRGAPVPAQKTRHLTLDPTLIDLAVTVKPNAKDDLWFQEVLWTILEKYGLDFRTEHDGTFVIVPGGPEI